MMAPRRLTLAEEYEITLRDEACREGWGEVRRETMSDDGPDDETWFDDYATQVQGGELHGSRTQS